MSCPIDRRNSHSLLDEDNVIVQAFLAASMKSDAELADWFKERLVWDSQETVIEMLKSGLFIRAYEPQVQKMETVSKQIAC